MGIERITDRIMQEAGAECNIVIRAAEEQARAALAAAEAEAEKLLSDAEQKGLNQRERMLKYKRAAADIDAGKKILALKQELLAECFVAAEAAIRGMDEDEYVELLISLGRAADMYGGRLLFNADERERIGQRVCDGLNAAAAAARRDKYGDEIQYAERFTLDDASGTMRGGYIIAYRATFADCTVEALVEEHRLELSGEAAKILFG